MGKLKVLSGADICGILAGEGFTQVRQKGDHVSMRRQLLETTITVTVPLHDEVAKGTLSSITRESGVPRSKFEV